MNTEADIQNISRPRILFVDDEKPILKALERFGRSQSWDVTTANSGAEALLFATDNEFDVVVSDMRMPEMNGAELLKKFEQHAPSTVRILLTGYSDISTLGSAINEAHIYNYLTKPWDNSLLAEVVTGALRLRDTEKERERLEKLTKVQNVKLSKLAILLDKRVKERAMEVDQALQLLQGSHERSKEALLDSVAIINRVIEWKETRTHGQSEFVTYYSVEMAKSLELSETDIESVRLGALMHRVGMLALPDEIRRKPLYALSHDEQELYRQYPLWGERSIQHSAHLGCIAKIVRHHRESINGKGYPDGLTLNDIPLAAQIVGLVSDFYDAYVGQVDKNIHGVKSAKIYISEWEGKRHDVELVNIFFNVIRDFCDTQLETCIVITQDLEPGMLLNEDIVTKTGALLLAKETILTSCQIDKLIEYESAHHIVFEINIRIPLNKEIEEKP